MDSEQSRAFLMALFLEWPAGVFAEVRAFQDGTPTQHWERSATAILDLALRLIPTHEVYVGVNPRRGRKGKKEAVAYVGMDLPAAVLHSPQELAP